MAEGAREDDGARPRQVPMPWRVGASVFLVLGTGLAFAGIASSRDLPAQLVAGDVPWWLGLVATGALALIIALAMWTSRPLHEASSTRGPDPQFHPTWAIGKAAGAAMAVQLVCGPLAVVLAGAANSRVWAALAWLPVALAGLGLTIWLGARQRGAVRLARLISGAAALPTPLPAGRRGRFQGKVVAVDGTPLERTVRYLQKSSSRTVTERAKDGSMTTRQEVSLWYEGHPRRSAMRAFEVAVGTEQVVVREGEATWSAPTEYLPVRKADAGGPAYQTRAAVADGDSIVVVGRVSRDDDQPSVHGSAAEPLLIFAAPAGALATLRRHALLAIAGVAALAAATIASVVLAVYIATLAMPR